MKNYRVKITGIGPITPAGVGRDAFWRGTLDPESRIRAVKLSGGNGECVVAAGEVRDFRVGAYALDASCLSSSREVQFALAATMLAIRDAGLTLADVRQRAPHVVFGAPAAPTLREQVSPNGKNGHEPSSMSSIVAAWVNGRAIADPAAGKLTALQAIGHAAESVARGEATMAICGAAEAPLQADIAALLASRGLGSDHAREPSQQCRPFDLWRRNGVLGEGACVFLLEAESSPRPAYARVAGAAHSGAEAADWDSLGEVLRLALGNASARPNAIDCIHADGTGTPISDRAEAKALVQCLGHAQVTTTPAVSIKGSVGNTLGAGGAIQVGCAALGMRHSAVPPTANWRHPDPACPLHLLTQSHSLALTSTLVVNRDVRGLLSCLLLKR